MTVERKLTIREAYVEASSFLQGHEVSEASNCAELLLQHLLGWSRSEMLLRWQEMFPVELEGQWCELLKRKAAGEPVQYIIGEQDFYGRTFKVTPAVLIPRPETELLVEQVVMLGTELWPSQEASPLVADIGAGSGAIAVSLAAERPSWRLMSSDISSAALAVAKANAERLGVAGRISFLEGDLLAPYIQQGLRLDAVVSNPPYIPEEDEGGLMPEVRLFEPASALYGGKDGLVLYRRLIAQLKELTSMPSLVGLEVGMGQAKVVSDMLAALEAWDGIRLVPDLAGIDRHVIAWKRR
ncbi:peptide chain release factor N(5)-glutamine methyltransferase [Paenibacillus sp. 32352]|uniref:peptide chain release factor N(5)-glutamine methyltransferase n=1 Tax=Paenibacillus sp. 32352 TaxID=1969111 RepID=UPI0009ADEF1E|nr:peptide chain release factor N(5)-glutamine methyltransferase [Paenibacillus sp. 32352]